MDIPLTLKNAADDCDDYFGCEPYYSKIMTFQIWLPTDVLYTKEDHDNFYSTITKEAPNIRARMQTNKVDLIMPKMSLKFNSDLIENFRTLGIETVFEYGTHFTPLFGADNDLEAKVRNINIFSTLELV